jgi:hypothetical protein
MNPSSSYLTFRMDAFHDRLFRGYSPDAWSEPVIIPYSAFFDKVADG